MIRKIYVVFGAGKAGMDLVQVLTSPISYVVDNDPAKWGTYFNGILICSPEQLLKEDKEQLRIFIASMYFPQIQSQLDAMGLANHKHYWNIIPYYGLLDKKTLVDVIEDEVKMATLQERTNSSNFVERMHLVFKIQKDIVAYQQNMRVLVAVDAADRNAVWVRDVIKCLEDFFKLQVMVYTEELPMSANEMEALLELYNKMGYSQRLYLGGSDEKAEFLQNYFKCFIGADEMLSDKKRWLDQLYDMTHHLGFSFEKVSVVVPNYNYENYLCKRLRSIIGQQYPIYEIIFLDDASSDNSVTLAKGLLTEYWGHSKILVNKVNSGSVFRQWIKGIELSQGDYIWIAEADDFASSLMLEKLMGSFREDKQVVLSFCDSMFVDERDEWQGFYSDAHVQYAHDSEARGYVEGIYDGKLYIKQYLSFRNSIPNVSAVVLKNDAIKKEYLSQLAVFQSCGDWYLYIAVLIAGKVSCNTMPMNFFTRHSQGVTLNASQIDYNREKNIIENILKIALTEKQ